MKNYKYMFFVLLDLSLPTNQIKAQEPWEFSLLYSSVERDVIQKKRLKTQNQPQYQIQTVQDHILQLNGIVYIDAQHWSIWLNNQMIDINHTYHGIEIVKVTPGSMVFKVNKANNSVLYRLYINQAINLDAIIYAEQHQHPYQVHN